MRTARNSRKAPIPVFVHDAGGGEVIGAYIKNVLRRRARVYGAGPALKIFKRIGVPITRISPARASIKKIVARHLDAPYALIAAPGWMTKLEIHALEEAKAAGLKTVVYMDSWMDDRRRFGYPHPDWKKRLPKEFWAGDRYALQNTRKEFKDIPARLVPNQYFKNERARLRGIRSGKRSHETILFASTIGEPSERLLKALLTSLDSCAAKVTLRIRFHPADRTGRYDAILRRSRKLRVQKSREADLVRDLARAAIVVGSETAALALASYCGLTTVNFVPNKKRPMLPFKEIVNAETPADAAAFVAEFVS
ncbi:MAG: hypothetical protein JO019_03835 [Candidatus Kaiserbacteria bacterium]|nr:hypothetical protein [Candidatus Kaiserbacteria bacterium]